MAVAPRFQDGLIYLDSDSGHIQWQCAGVATPWHGQHRMSADQMIVEFDSLAGIRAGPPLPKSSVLFFASPGVFVGYDYKQRQVKMTAVARFTYNGPTGSWSHSSDWSPHMQEWFEVVELI